MGRGLQAAPGLVCFDLDGTLYHDDRIYLRMIDYYFAGTPWEKEIGSVKAEMSRVLAGGNPAFRCGRFAPKEWLPLPRIRELRGMMESHLRLTMSSLRSI